MVGSDRLNVPAIDNSSHQSSSTAKSNQCTCPLLGWGAPLCKIQRGVAVSSVGHLCACPLLPTLVNNLDQCKAVVHKYGPHSLCHMRADWAAKHGTHSALPRLSLFSFKECRGVTYIKTLKSEGVVDACVPRGCVLKETYFW